MKSPDMHRRAATLAGAIRSRTIVLWHEGGAEDFRARGEDQDLTADALAAYAAQDTAAPDQPAEVREVVVKAIHRALDPFGSDPFDAAIARKALYGGADSPMVAQAKSAADFAFADLAAAGYRITRDAPARPTVVVAEPHDQAGDQADILAEQILNAHCTCYNEAWPSHTCVTEVAEVAAQIRAFARPIDDRPPFAPGAPVTVQHGTSPERPDTVIECMRATDGPGWSVRLASGIWVSAECCTARDEEPVSYADVQGISDLRDAADGLVSVAHDLIHIAAKHVVAGTDFGKQVTLLSLKWDRFNRQRHAAIAAIGLPEVPGWSLSRRPAKPSRPTVGDVIERVAKAIHDGFPGARSFDQRAGMAKAAYRDLAAEVLTALRPRDEVKGMVLVPMGDAVAVAARPTVGETWETGGVMVKAVPVEPTEAMEEDADDAFHAAWKASNEIWERGEAYRESVGLPRRLKHGSECHASVTFVKPIWSAMLAAVAKEATP